MESAEALVADYGHWVMDFVLQSTLCSECNKRQTVPNLVLRIPEGWDAGDAPATMDALARYHKAAGTSKLDGVRLDALLSMLHSFGSRHVRRTLLHPEVVGLVAEHVSHFACPACDPWNFGVARKAAATIMARGLLRFPKAVTLLETTRATLKEIPRHLWEPKPLWPHIHHHKAAVLETFDALVFSISLGFEGSWFDGWSKLAC
jgi:hypothetical protein